MADIDAGDRFDPERLGLLARTIERDVAAGLYHGAVIQVARRGHVSFSGAFGAADAAGSMPLAPDAVFSLFSVTKAFINVLMLRAIERGQMAFTTRVRDILPAFDGPPRERITVLHMLTSRTGLPGLMSPREGMFNDDLGELVAAAIQYVHGDVEPGTRVSYSPAISHILMGEMLRRTDPAGRDFRTIVQQDLFDPLGMTGASFGVRADLRPRKVAVDLRDTLPIELRGRGGDGPYSLLEQESNEAPHVGACAAVSDLHRFAEMLRRGGTLDGARILSARTLTMARQNWTGDTPNELYRGVALRAGWEEPPAYIGLGFSLRGTNIVANQLGTLTSPETFGNYGAGSTLYWVDPELDISFACLTAGLLPQAANIARFQKLSDIVAGAAL